MYKINLKKSLHSIGAGLRSTPKKDNIKPGMKGTKSKSDLGSERALFYVSV